MAVYLEFRRTQSPQPSAEGLHEKNKHHYEQCVCNDKNHEHNPLAEACESADCNCEEFILKKKPLMLAVFGDKETIEGMV